MSAPQPSKSPLAIAALASAVLLSAGAVFLCKDSPRLLSGMAFGVSISATVAAFAAAGRRKGPAPVAKLGQTELAPLAKGVSDSRTEIINAMAILQQEIRLLQDARADERDTRALSDELARLGTEVAALKSAVLSDPTRKLLENATSQSRAPFSTPAPAKPAAKPQKEEEDDFDVAPLSFDDEDEKPIAKALGPKAGEAAKPAVKTEPVFAPEPEPVLETGLEPEDMDDDGDWLTGGLEEEDLVVTKKVDFEDIVKKDAARPKPKVDEEEQRVLREEMAQMADEEDWVGGGLEDRDVKVKKTTSNDALFEKMRAEIEAKRAQKEAAVGVRAPARGETALLVNVTVPTGTKLFVRGVGPGLDVDKGAAMQQSGHGKWQWICPEQGKPCVVTVWENDDVQAEGNPIRIPGGFALTVTPTFRRKLRL